MEAFVIILREGIEAALIVGLVLTYLNRTGRDVLRPWVYTGLGLAAAASVIGAVIFNLIGFDPENEVLEGTLLALAAVMVFSLVVWMWRASRSMKQQVEDRLAVLTTSQTGEQGWGLLFFVFFMVFREGVEMVLFLAALSLTATPDLTNLIGGLAGLGLAVLFGVLLVKGNLRLNLRRFFAVTGLVLLILVIRLAAGSLHEFFEVSLLPSTPALLSVIGFIVKDSTSTLTIVLLVALPVLSMLPELRPRPQLQAAQPGEGDAERRKRLAAFYRARNWQAALVSLTLLMVLALGGAVYVMGQAVYKPHPNTVTAESNSLVHIPTDGMEMNKLHLYHYQVRDTTVAFMVIRRDEEDYVLALNACSICPPVGYHQEGDMLICENCNAPINLDTVGMSGGCNPIPLAAAMDGSDLVISVASLEQAAQRFSVVAAR
jgi:high-affinity iron transporter